MRRERDTRKKTATTSLISESFKFIMTLVGQRRCRLATVTKPRVLSTADILLTVLGELNSTTILDANKKTYAAQKIEQIPRTCS